MGLFGWIVHCVNAHSLWKTFGYRLHPRHGAFFNRLRSKAKVGDEQFLWKEFQLVAFVQATKSVYQHLIPKHAELVVARIIELLVDGLPSVTPPWQLFDFSCREDCANFYRDGILQYLNAEEDCQLAIFVRRYMSSCGDTNLPRFSTSGLRMFYTQLPELKRQFDEYVKQVVLEETSVQDNGWTDYVSDISRLFQKG